MNERPYFDLSGEIALADVRDDKIALFGAVQNLFDKTPPITGVGGYGTTRALYDTMGRVFTAGVRTRF